MLVLVVALLQFLPAAAAVPVAFAVAMLVVAAYAWWCGLGARLGAAPKRWLPASTGGPGAALPGVKIAVTFADRGVDHLRYSIRQLDPDVYEQTWPAGPHECDPGTHVSARSDPFSWAA